MTDAGLSERAHAAHAAWFADAATVLHRGCAQQLARPSFSPSPGPSAPTSTLHWPGAPRTTRCSGSASSTGSVGPGSSSATAEAHSGSWPRWTRPATRARPEDRADALLLAAWIEASTGRLELARDHIAAATELADAIDDVDLQARCCYYLAYVVSHHGEFRQAMELTDRSRALYDGLDRPWDQAANGLFAARAAISAGDQERSVDAADQVQHWLRTVEDPWLHVRSDAMLGELARLQHRFDDAVVHIGRAAEASGRLGFPQTEAYQVTSLGRAQCQAGDYDAGVATLELAVDKAESTGDVRLAALARVHLGRVLRAVGQVAQARAALEAAAAWHRDAGGGEQAALGECLLAAMDAADRVARRRGTSGGDPRRCPAPGRRPGRGLRPRRARPRRRGSGRHHRGRGTSVRRLIGGWTPPPTSSPTSTEPTPAFGQAGIRLGRLDRHAALGSTPRKPATRS